MAWYGPQGDCGCCEGPCDLPGLVTDDFTTVSPKWRFSVDGGATNLPEIDTLFPGAKIFRDQSVVGGSGTPNLWRCHSMLATFFNTRISYKQTVLNGYNLTISGSGTSSLFNGYYCWIQLGLGNDLTEPIATLGDVRFNVIKKNFEDNLPRFDCYFRNNLIATVNEEPEPGDEVEMVITTPASGTLCNLSWSVNGSEVANVDRNITISHLRATTAQRHIWNLGIADQPASTEMWTQDYEVHVEDLA